MVMQKQDLIDQQLAEEVAQIDTDATAQEAEALGATEAASAAHAGNASEEDPFAEAARSIRENEQPVEPELVDKGYLDAQLAGLPDLIRREMESALQGVAPSSQPVAPVAASSPDPDVRAFEAMLRERGNATEEQIATMTQQFVAQRDALKKEEEEKNQPDRLATMEEAIRRIEERVSNPVPVQQEGTWSEAEVDQINAAIDTIALANGMQINRQDRTQMNAVIAGVEPGEDPRAVIQKVGANMGQIKASYVAPSAANQALQTNVAQLPPTVGATTTQDTLAFTSEDEIRDAIATNRISLMEYEKYRAQLPGR